MADDELRPNATGSYAIRHRNTYEVNAAGYGNGDWTYELVDLATNRVVKMWTGRAHQSPWDSWSMGVESVTWDGDVLVIRYSSPGGDPYQPSEEERVPLATLLG